MYDEIVYVQNNDIKKVFCPSCDLLIIGHDLFSSPKTFAVNKA